MAPNFAGLCSLFSLSCEWRGECTHTFGIAVIAATVDGQALGDGFPSLNLSRRVIGLSCAAAAPLGGPPFPLGNLEVTYAALVYCDDAAGGRRLRRCSGGAGHVPARRAADTREALPGLSPPHSMLVERAGRIEQVDAVWQDHWKVIRLPIFPLPACIDGRAYASGIECTSMDVFELGESGEEIARRHHADKVLAPEYSAEDFARFIAKMAYGYAIERYGLDAFEEVYVLPAMLGESNDIGRWVGCPDRREFPVRNCTVSVGFKIIPRDDLAVRIKMFAQFDGAEYVVVVGKVKEVYRNYFHARGEQG